jgi:hypothetical protein
MSDELRRATTPGQRGLLCPACGTPVLVGNVALGWGARPLFRYGGRRGTGIDVPLRAGLCPACHLVSFWAEPSEALHAALQLHRTEDSN